MIPLGKPLATRERVELMDQLKEQKEPFGDKVILSESTKQVVFGNPLSQPSEIIQEIKENVYKSRRTEILGKTLDRKYVYPEEVKENAFSFGVPTLTSLLNR